MFAWRWLLLAMVLLACCPLLAGAESNDESDSTVEAFQEPTARGAPSSSPGRGWTDPVTGMEFVWVPGGCYRMGSNSGGKDEKPVHEVCLDGFWIGKYEVTQAEWRQVMGSNPSHFKGDRNPVEKVSWHDAQDFVRRLRSMGGGNVRLPTEAEWEYAARSGGRRETYAGGEDVNRVAWYDKNSGKRSHPVGTKAPNGLGIYDMSGNVWEWCQDNFDKKAYSRHSRHNPVNRTSVDNYASRGGSWFANTSYCRTSDRGHDSPGRYNNTGFRLVRTP